METDSMETDSVEYGFELTGLNLQNNKSILSIGDGLKIYSEKRFNWLQRKMYKILLNIEVENIKGEIDGK